MNIKELLLKQAKSCPLKSAILFQEKNITFQELKDTSFKLANYLLEAGVKRDDKIAVFMPNIPEAILAFLAVFSAEAVIVPLDFMLIENEIINFLTHSQAKVLIANFKKGINLTNIKSQCVKLNEIIVLDQEKGEFTSWDFILEQNHSGEPQLEHREEALSSIFYTSGSTGHPKGVCLEFRHLDNPPKVINHFLKVSNDDIFLCGGVPFSHIGGLGYILLMLSFSSSLILMERFKPLEFLKNLERYKATIFCIVPAMYVAILALKEYDKFDFSHLRFAVVFGAPSSAVLLRRFHKVCPRAVVLNGWGMTETSAPNAFSPYDEDKISSIGYFNFNLEAKIVDDQGNKLEPGQQGELWVKGEAIMREYYKEPALTEEILTRERWLKTGDIVRLESDGLYYIVGRKKDMIKVAGEIVFPAEVEEKIQKHFKVKENAVIGVVDNLRGEVPKAFIVLKEQSNLEEQELKDFLKEHLAHFKIPHYFEIVKELPKNRVGKVDKIQLKERANL